jgi:Uncharacterised protein family (UPF0236)
LRPFSLRAGVGSRSYSLPLQRALTDFGADVPFAEAVRKMREHYGLEVSVSAVREITESHGERMREQQEDQLIGHLGPQVGWERMITQADGSLVPIVRNDAAAGAVGVDRRKQKELIWREARLCLAHEPGQLTARYAATLGDVEATGARWLDCVARAGAGAKTQIHCVGDGAAWIALQAQHRFGPQASYLVDFYHVSEYLSAAAASIAPTGRTAWRHRQQARLKENELAAVLAELRPHLEAEQTPDTEAPVRACHRYLSNQREHLDYRSALSQNLPIGSGEVESGHRYVIQARLKRAGAWWKEENAEKMLALRVTRANGEWEAYWQRQRQGAD